MSVLLHIQKISAAALSLSLLTTFGASSVVTAQAAVQPNRSQSQSQIGSQSSARLAEIKKDGNQKIKKRLSDLVGLSLSISQSKKLLETNKTALLTEVQTTQEGLEALQVRLNSATTVSEAKAAQQSISKDYRVYMLVVPKVKLIKSADAQIAKQEQLTSYNKLLRTNVDAKIINKTELVKKLDQMSALTGESLQLATNAETSVASLKPVDYTSSKATIKKAQADIKAAKQKSVKAHELGKQVQKTLKQTRK